MNRHRPTSSAFTLIELILVLAILALVAATVAPSLRAFGVGRGNNDTASLVVGLASYARTQAVTEGQTYRLNFDPQAHTVWLTVADGGVFDSPTSDFGRRFQFSRGVEMTTDLRPQQDGLYVEFRPSGRTDPARFTFTDSLGGRITVACTSATELFRILRPEETR